MDTGNNTAGKTAPERYVSEKAFEELPDAFQKLAELLGEDQFELVAVNEKDSQDIYVQDGEIRLVYLMLPLFSKEEDECENDFERWIYILKHMDTLDRMPFKARKAVFERLEKMASKANMTPEERAQYEKEWKVYNDYFNTLDFAEQKGMLRGKESSARMMKSKGLAIDLISECTGLTAEEIEAL